MTEIENAVYEVIAELSGYDPSDLSSGMRLGADLGLHAESRHALFYALRERDEVGPAVERTDPAVLSAVDGVGELLSHLSGATEGSGSAVSGTDSFSWPDLVAVVARQTGLPNAAISADLHLEGDLGLDSLKMVELLNALAAMNKRADGRPANLTLPTDQLLEAQTLGEVYAILEPVLVAVADTAPADTHVPVGTGTPAPVAEGPATLTVLDAQYILLAAHNVVTTCSLASYVRLGGSFDAELGRAAWADLIARHPMLRVRFDWPADATRLAQFEQPLVADTNAPPIQWLETGVPADGVEEAIQAVLEAVLNFEWDLRRWPLHRLLALQTATGDTVLFFAVNHLIADGLSIQRLIHEFLELYRARAAGDTPQLPPSLSAAEYNECAERINAWSSEDEEARFTEYARTQGARRYHWSPEGRAVEGPCRNARRSHRLSAATTECLIDWTREAGMPLSTLLTAAYLQAAERLQATDGTPIVNIPTAGRTYPGVDARYAVGCFAQNMSLDFPRAEDSGDCADYLSRVHDCYATGIAHGYDRAQNKSVARTMRDTEILDGGAVTAVASGLLTSMVKTNLYLPYLGTVPLHSTYGDLVVRDYAAATSTNPGTVDMIAEIFDGRLQLAVGYDAGNLSADVVDGLLTGVETALQELVRCPVPSQRAPAVPTDPMAADDSLAITVRCIAEEVGQIRIGSDELGQDLEADLGLDSLERVRMISRLGQTLNRPIDRRALLDCRSLRQMVAVLARDEITDGDAKPEGAPVEAASASVGAAPPATDEPPPGGAGVPCYRIIEQCRRTPWATAVLDRAGALTYAELDERSNRLGRQLRDIGSGRGAAPIGILLDPGVDMIVAMVAAMKAGVPYVPLDPTHPPDRLRYVAGHSGMNVVIADPGHARTLDAVFDGELPMDCIVSMGAVGDLKACAGVHQILTEADWMRRPPEALERVTEPDDPMLVLYTSGSTGRPKGVLLGHRGYDNRLLWMQRAFKLQPGERVAQKTSCSFDVSVWELLWPLMVGATVCPVDTETVRDPWGFADWVAAQGIGLMHFVPSMFGEFLASLEDTDHTFPDLRQLVFSGEALPVAFVRRWMDRFGTRVALANLYGPTEASIDVTCHHIRSRPTDDERLVPIGRAIDNVKLRVLDDDLRAVPPGTPGELWIGGVQLAHEYLHNPKETARAFRVSPVAEDDGQLLYRTGDRVIERADGVLEYRGRLDSQVKIRGFRIELGEVESVLGALKGIEECAVAAVDTGDMGQRRLVAWYSGRAYAAAELRRRLAQTLPSYMVPHRFLRRSALPKNANGKLDRNALTLDDDASSERAGVQPEPVSTAARPAEDTVTRLPLGPAQRWLVDHFSGEAHWAGYTTFRYLGDLDTEAFASALIALEKRHSALRTSFTHDDGVWQQCVHAEPAGTTPEVIDARDRSASALAAELVERLCARGLALQVDAGGPLWHVIVMREADHSWQIGFVAHHMVCDLVSTDVILRDIWQIYDHGAENLGAVEGYDVFVASLVEAERSGAMEQHFEYWRRNCPSPGRPFVVPRDWALGSNTEASGTFERFTFASRLNDFLKREGRRAFGTRLYAVLLAPLYRLLHDWTGRNDVTVSHRGHGRGLETRFFSSVGNFAVNYPVTVELTEAQHWGELVKRIHEALTSVPMEGATYDWIGPRLPDVSYPDSRLTSVRANYLGSQSVPSDPRFEWCAMDHAQRLASPDSERTALLEFFFRSVDGCLRLEIAYSSACHDAATVRWLGERYLELATSLAVDVGMRRDDDGPNVVARD